MFSGDITMRFAEASLPRLARHLAIYPLEVAACTLPWSILLLPYVRPDFRGSLGAARRTCSFWPARSAWRL